MPHVDQIGGDHYQSVYQHWDWVIDIGMGYLAGNATKYVSRWRKKNGVQDLEKGRSYIVKMIEDWSKVEYTLIDPPENIDELNARFVQTNGLSPQEAKICYVLSDLMLIEQAKGALRLLDELIGMAKAAPTAPHRQAAPTLAGTPPVVAPAPAGAAAGGAVGQGAGNPAPGGFHSVGGTKTEEGYNG